MTLQPLRLGAQDLFLTHQVFAALLRAGLSG
jgi:hypothetical protein